MKNTTKTPEALTCEKCGEVERYPFGLAKATDVLRATRGKRLCWNCVNAANAPMTRQETRDLERGLDARDGISHDDGGDY